MSESLLVEIGTDKPELDCKLCYLPAQTEDSKIQLGPLYEYGVCRSHHFCLMFSSGLEQKGEEEEGIKGFMPADIIKEWKRGGFLKCFYCKKKHATVGCFESNCRKCYHLPCGLKNGALQQFYGNFKTFCIDHRPIQTPLATKNKKTKLDKDCSICFDTLDNDWNENIWTPCCGGWFHRTCMTRMASTAGAHFFKCPLCNNIDEFTKEMLEFGIYVPDQDAKWETEGEAFNDLLLRPDSCDAPVCKCPGGRKMDVEDSKWETVICVCCGAQGIHIECGGLNFDRPRWKCNTCRDVLKKIPNKPVSVFSRVKRNQQDEAGTMEKLMAKIKFNVKPSRTPLTNIHNIQVTVGHVKIRLDSAPVLDIPLPVQLKQENKEKPKSEQSRQNEEQESKQSSKKRFATHEFSRSFSN
ncbi:PHD finger protein 7 [Eurytemora carolleeae]|uniref:PHD finger protein 7 n=1 Tax=Eurytemora carolleeae TaxID=1294199 RepID=UPI000C7607E9|nr:PHD finger protein 7 [Eurytemora carolleeae]|eukprot:XP_023329403.1 PHD finger protein 7-like [Eurytemora affinis]